MQFPGLVLAVMLLVAATPTAAEVPPLSDAFGDVFDAAMAASPTARQLNDEQREWVHYRDLDEYGRGAGDDESRMQELRRRTGRDEALARIELASADAMASCVGAALKQCSSPAAGWLTSPAGDRLFWQLQQGVTDETGLTGGVVLLSAGGMGPIRPKAWAFEGYRYEAPTLVTADGKLYVAVAGRMQGTGNGNADVIFRWDPAAAQPLVQVDNWSWREALKERLPAGLEVWKGVDFKYADSEIWAWTLLWREGDGNCCPSGGSAGLSFRLENDVLVLDGASVRDAIVEVALSEPAEVLDFVSRWETCAHFGGEEPYDEDRRQEIETALSDQRCAALEADAARLETTYADQPATLAVIRRMQAE